MLNNPFLLFELLCIFNILCFYFIFKKLYSVFYYLFNYYKINNQLNINNEINIDIINNDKINNQIDNEINIDIINDEKINNQIDNEIDNEINNNIINDDKIDNKIENETDNEINNYIDIINDEKTYIKMNKIREKILILLEIEIEKWNNNDEIEINSNFNSLLNGDWNRNPIDNKLNLLKLKGNKIRPLEIYKMIKTEMKSDIKPYNYNFNPNWFFIFFDKFYEEYKYEYNNDLMCIEFDKNIKLRKEIKYIIEIHSKLLLNKNVKRILDVNHYNYLIKNCLIQKKVKGYYKNYYVDLSYKIDNYYLLIEINEEHHIEEKDLIREEDILNYNKNYKILNFKVEIDNINNFVNLIIIKLLEILKNKISIKKIYLNYN